MLIDAGLRRQDGREGGDIYGFDRVATSRSRAGRCRAGGGRHRHRRSPRICTSITPAASPRATAMAVVRPRFPRAQYIVRRGEWDDATHPHERNRASYFAGELSCRCGRRRADAGRRATGDHAGRARAPDGRPHDASPGRADRVGGQTAVFTADLIPTAAHVPTAVDHGLRPLSDGDAGVQAGVPAGGGRARVSDILRARPGDRAGYLGKGRAITVERVIDRPAGWQIAEPCSLANADGAGARNEHERRDRHHRRQRPVRHGRADRPRRSDARRRRSATRRRRTCSARCAAGAWPSSRGTARPPAACRPS